MSFAACRTFSTQNPFDLYKEVPLTQEPFSDEGFSILCTFLGCSVASVVFVLYVLVKGLFRSL
jgi:hypothetical protein